MSMKIFLSRLNFQLKKLTGTYLKVLALSLLFAGLCTGCASPGGGGGGDSILVIPGEDTPVDGLSSVDFASAMCVGWNLGNTFDSAEYGNKNNKGNNYETAWGMPKTTHAMINTVAAKGFKTIRIPVSWHNHITEGTNYTIDSGWLARVKQVVDWAREDKMFVIINIHHDNLTSEQMSSTYGFSVNTDTDQQNASKNYIQKIWTQVANYFKDYDNHLIFELLNEPRNIDGPNAGFGDQPNLSALNEIISQYNQTALNAIRATGGNNTNRFVMAPYYAASPWKSSGWTIPSDNASDKILISVHAYDPYEFAMGTMSDTTFAENEEGSQLGYLFDELKTRWVVNGRGVVMGEASCTDKNNLTDRLAWFNSYIPKAKAINCPVILWDNMQTATTSPADKDVPERHGYLNRNTRTWFFPTLVNAMISKAGGVVDCYSTGGENGNENGGENSSGTPIVVWTGSQDLGHWKGEDAITLASSLFASATDSSYLRLTISKGAECNATEESGDPCSNNYSSIHPITDWTNGNITFTTDTANATVNSDKQLEITNIIPANGTTTVNISPDSTSWNAIKSNGLIIYGHKVTITKIELM